MPRIASNGFISSLPVIGQAIPIVPDDLMKLRDAAPGSRTVTNLARLRASHHNVARLIAWGLDDKEVAAITGYHVNRISQLKQAPAMAELIASYMARVGEQQEEQVDAYLSLKMNNMIAAERHIADHIAELDEAGELLPVKTALAVSSDGADRLGYAKKSQVTHNHEFASELEKAIARSNKAKLIDATPVASNEPPARGLSQLPVSAATPPTRPQRNSDAQRSQRPLITRRA